ncbi:SpoIIE family protein phosphatase [Streptomyces physcomitrii]|uniref:SpoIIE family protein phosphatase n=1 Tax=Streptomyces physcomitrii TaxID=2724184 RepID=UPI003446B0E7
MGAWESASGVTGEPVAFSWAASAVLGDRLRVHGWSPAAQELLGYPPEDVLGTPVTRLVGAPGHYHGEDLPPATLGPEGLARDLVLRHRDGRALHLAAAHRPLPASPGGQETASLLLLAPAGELRDWETGQAVLRALFTQSPIGLTLYDTELRVTWANDTCAREMAGSPERYRGLHPDELVPGGEILGAERPGGLRALVRGVLETGEPVIDLHYRGSPPEDPAGERIWSYSYYRLLDGRGRPVGVCEESFDITERYRAERRLHLLVRAGERIGTTLDPRRTATELALTAVPQIADRVAVDLYQDVLEGRAPRGAPHRERPLVRVASFTAPSAAAGLPAALARDARPDYPESSSQARALRGGSAVLDPDRGAGDAPGLSTLAVPLRAQGAGLGLVTFVRGGGWPPYRSDDRDLAEELVRRTAVAVDNARRYAGEHQAAVTLQRDLLPGQLPSLSAVEAAYRYLPADSRVGVGGDWFDVIPLSGCRVGFVVGDVVGHGLRAAATMGRLRATVRALAQLDLAPEELLSRLDDLIVQWAEERAAPEEGGTPHEETTGGTCLYGIYDPVSQRCALARAGHLLPVLVTPEGRAALRELPSGPPLGTGGLPFESAEVDLPEGSLLALFTDGLVEARDLDLDEGLDRLTRVLAGPARPLDRLCGEVLGVLPSPMTTDDAALLLVRSRALAPGSVVSWEMPAEAAAVPELRRRAREQLAAWGLDEFSFTTELIVGEFLSNAVRHADGPIGLRLIRDRSLLCEVSDASLTSPHVRQASMDDEGGRGLFLVSQTAQRWGTRYTRTGKVLWAEQPLPPAA